MIKESTYGIHKRRARVIWYGWDVNHYWFTLFIVANVCCVSVFSYRNVLARKKTNDAFYGIAEVLYLFEYSFAGFGCHALSLLSKQIVFRYKKITLREQGRKQFAQGINEL